VKTEEDLKRAGFTESGIKRYKQTASEYEDALYQKSVTFGDADKASDLTREVTHDHVKAAAHTIAASFGGNEQSTVQIFCQVGEYVAAAFAGLGAGKLDQAWGIAVFGISLSVGVILFVVRNTRRR
jgi:hypothetical protein